MNEPQPPSETGRIEAFSDGVIAIVITIMVLELRPPEHATLGGLLRLWPIFLAYALSFLQVGVYWVNHHRLLERATLATSGLQWANMLWLFSISLIPFGTAWWGEHPADAIPTATYMATLLLPALVYPWLEIEALCNAAVDDTSDQHRIQRRKITVSVALYVAAMALAFLNTAFSIACTFIVSLLWVLPGSRIDRWFGKA
jgi:uncharacterized membrane protein